MELHSAIHSLREDNRRLWRHSTSTAPTPNLEFPGKLDDKERIHAESSTPIQPEDERLFVNHLSQRFIVQVDVKIRRGSIILVPQLHPFKTGPTKIL